MIDNTIPYEEQAITIKLEKVEKELHEQLCTADKLSKDVCDGCSIVMFVLLVLINYYMITYSWYLYYSFSGPCVMHERIHLSNDIQHYDRYTLEFNSVMVNITDVHVSDVTACTYTSTTNQLKVGTIGKEQPTIIVICWMPLFLFDMSLFRYTCDIVNLLYLSYKIRQNERTIWHLKGKLV